MYMCKFTYLLWQGETAELVEMAEIATVYITHSNRLIQTTEYNNFMLE